MSDLGFAEFRKKNVERCVAAFHPIDAWTPADWAVAAAGELGEALNIIKKMRRGDLALADLPDRRKLALELADAVTYIDLLAERCGIDLGKAVRDKFNIVSERRHCSVRL